MKYIEHFIQNVEIVKLLLLFYETKTLKRQSIGLEEKKDKLKNLLPFLCSFKL